MGFRRFKKRVKALYKKEISNPYRLFQNRVTLGQRLSSSNKPRFRKAVGKARQIRSNINSYFTETERQMREI